VHTDIISHSVDGFPTRTPEEFLEFLRAAAASGPGTPSPSPVEKFLGSHPAALAFVQTPKPSPASFAKEAYFGVTALRFVNSEGAARYGRFRITPSTGIENLNDAAAKAKDGNYLFDELTERVKHGPVQFGIQVQVAEEGDLVDDATVHWPENRQLVPFGTVALTEMIPDDEAQQRTIIFDPIPRVDGIEPSADPLLELRAAVYLLSGRRRRQAPATRTA
jgi:catalase